MIDTLRAERAKAVDEAARLQRELDGVAAAAAGSVRSASAEVGTLREERELIRNRVVADDLADRQAESLNVANSLEATMSTRVVHVEIHGQQYAIRSELDPGTSARSPRTSTRRCAWPRASWPAPTRCASPSSPPSTSSTSSAAPAPTPPASKAASSPAPPTSRRIRAMRVLVTRSSRFGNVKPCNRVIGNHAIADCPISQALVSTFPALFVMVQECRLSRCFTTK